MENCVIGEEVAKKAETAEVSYGKKNHGRCWISITFHESIRLEFPQEKNTHPRIHNSSIFKCGKFWDIGTTKVFFMFRKQMTFVWEKFSDKKSDDLDLTTILFCTFFGFQYTQSQTGQTSQGPKVSCR